AKKRRARIAAPVVPRITRPGHFGAVIEIPGVDVVDASLEIMVAQLVVQAQAITRDIDAMRRIRLLRVCLRVDDTPTPRRDECRVLYGRAADVRQVGIEPRVARLLGVILAAR